MIALLRGVLQAIEVDALAAAGTGRPVLELVILLHHNNSTNDRPYPPHQAATIKLTWVAEMAKATDRNRMKSSQYIWRFLAGDLWLLPSFHLFGSVFTVLPIFMV